MTLICNTKNSEEQTNRIYNDYDLANVGERFSESFKEWNYHFYHNMYPILSGTFTNTNERKMKHFPRLCL